MPNQPDPHLLLLPDGTGAEDVEALVRMRHPGVSRDADGTLRIGGDVTLCPPRRRDPDDGEPTWPLAVAVHTPRERAEPPVPGAFHPDGMHRAFPDGMPVRREARVVELALGIARRLGGAVRVLPSGVVLVPDPDAAVDVVVHSPSWLEPERIFALVAAEHPEARLAVEGEQWLDADDGSPAAAPAVLDAYAVVLDVGPDGRDGVVEVLVHPDEELEPAIADQAWAGEAVAYWVRWSPQDEHAATLERPGEEFVAARRRAADMARGLAHVLLEETRGVAVDADGFVVDAQG